MLIIDLDNPKTLKKPAVLQVTKAVTVPKNPIVPEVLDPVSASPLPVDQKARLLRKLEEEDSYTRHLRAMNHQKFFDQLGPDLLPLKGADFTEVYEEQKVYRERLKSIFIKKEQLERTGKIDQPKYLTDAELARMGALKHDRSNAYKLIAKVKKKIDEANLKANSARVNDLEKKLEELGIKIMECSHEIDKIVKNGVVS